MRAKTLVAATIICYLNNHPFGRVIGFRWNSQTPNEPIFGLDSMIPFELAPTTAMCQGTVQLIRTVGDAGAEGAGMTARFEDLPREKYFSMALVDIGTDSTIFQADYCKVNGQSWDISPKGVVSGSIEFSGITWNNELRPIQPL